MINLIAFIEYFSAWYWEKPEWSNIIKLPKQQRYSSIKDFAQIVLFSLIIYLSEVRCKDYKLSSIKAEN